MTASTAPGRATDRTSAAVAVEPATSARPLRPALTSVDPVERSQRRKTMFVGGIVGVVLVASVFAVVSMHVQMAENQFGLRDTNEELAEQTRLNGLYRDDVARMSSPDWIVQEARRLGLVPPETVTPIPIEAIDSTKSDQATGDEPSDETANDATTGQQDADVAAP